MYTMKELAPAERSRRVLRALVLERRRLRAAGVDDATLEANRLAIEYWQDHLARKLRNPQRARQA
jgi:hypothetical protein